MAAVKKTATTKSSAKPAAPKTQGGAQSAKKKSPAKAAVAKKSTSASATATPRLAGLQLLILRHAKAENAEVFAESGLDDDLRPLTDAGRKRLRKVMKGLKYWVDDISLVLTSPYSRAVETAEFLAGGFDVARVVETDCLQPEVAPEEVLQWLLAQAEDGAVGRTIALVGHEPQLSTLAGWFLSGKATSFLELKKAGACLLSFPEGVAAGKGRLLWLLTPAQLRAGP